MTKILLLPKSRRRGRECTRIALWLFSNEREWERVFHMGGRKVTGSPAPRTLVQLFDDLREPKLLPSHFSDAHCAREIGSGAFQGCLGDLQMKRTKWLLLSAALALPLSIGTAHAVVNPDKLPQVACSDLKFSAAFLKKWPRAPEACLDGRVYKGQRYAKFEAKVYINSPDFTTINVLNAAGDTVQTFSVKPGPNQHVIVNGKDKPFHDLAVGEKITVWVSEKRLDAAKLPGSTTDKWALLPPINQ
jgi:hypothetical protein